MTFFHRIWGALEGDRRLMIASVGTGLVFTALGIVPPLLVGEMVRAIINRRAFSCGDLPEGE